MRAAWWLPPVGLVIGGAVALVSSLLSTPLYTAQTQLFVSTQDAASTADAYTGSIFSQQRVASYAALLTGEELAARVAADLGLDIAPDSLAGQISAEPVTETVLINVSVTDSRPERARDIAEAVGTQFSLLVGELETPAGAVSSPVRVTVTDAADLPLSPSSPKTARNVVLGLLLGLLVGTATAIARTRWDRTVKDPKEAAELAASPVIGTVVRDDAFGSVHVIDRLKQTRVAEDYRQLRINLQFLNVDDPPRVIMITSAMPSEGKTTAVVNLALALAEAGREVTIVDTDLRRSRVTNYLGMVGGVGLTNVLAGTADIADVLQPYRDSGVSVIGAGPIPPNPSELLASGHMSALIDQLRGKSEYVLLDAPPMLPVADSTGLAVMVDGVLLSVRYGQSRKDQLEQTAATLQRVGARTLGLILNVVPPKTGVSAAYGYGSTYGDPPADGGRRRASHARREPPRA